MFVQVSVAGMCRDSGLLFQCGALTQAGSAGGALMMFLLVNQVVGEFVFSIWNSSNMTPRSVSLRATTSVVEANRELERSICLGGSNT